MPEIVCKIINDDGTEQSFGPMTVPKTVAKDVADSLDPHEQKNQEQRAANRATEIEAEQARRSAEAEKANADRENRGQRGLDPDAETDNTDTSEDTQS